MSSPTRPIAYATGALRQIPFLPLSQMAKGHKNKILEGVSESDGRAVQIVRVGALDLHGRDLADAQRAVRRDVDGAVDVRCVALAAALGDTRANLVDDDLLTRADLALDAAG